MIRQIIKIDPAKCDGCGLCVKACHENAIGMVDGKAKLVRDDYCDGLGSCLPVCPTSAITIEKRETLKYNEREVMQNIKQEEMLLCGCSSARAKEISRVPETLASQTTIATTQLRQWPVQIKLAPVSAPYFENADLLISADCAAYAYGNFHQEFMEDKITLIGCPKLDGCDYSEKLASILKGNTIKSIAVVRMEVPCCRGIEHAVTTALHNSRETLHCQKVIISTDGQIIGR